MDYRIEVALHVDASRRQVWDVLQDLPAWPEWDPYIVDMVRDDGRASVGQHWLPGTRWNERVRRGPFAPRFRLTTTGLTPGRYVEWTARYLFVTGIHGWSIADAPAGVTLRSIETFRGWAPLIWSARIGFSLFRVRRMTEVHLGAMARRAEQLP